MNKKKSKALAFLLAASLLIPSTNGIVSAAELNASTDKVVEDVTVVEEPSLESDKVVESEKTGENWGDDYETATTFTINSLEELKAFRDLVNTGKDFKGKTVNLNSNIDLNSEEWEPIGSGERDDSTIKVNSKVFKGTFNGNGHTVSKLEINSGESDTLVGFFAGVDGATLKDINFEKVSISSGSKNVGTLVGMAIGNSTISGVNVKSGKISAAEVGGVIGRVTKEGTVESCTNAATIEGRSAGGSAAGIVSKAYYSQEGKEINITNCKNTGEITGQYAAGGIVGLAAANIKNCINTAHIKSIGISGGIVGEHRRYGIIEKNENNGYIEGKLPTGGIVGWLRYLDPASYPKMEIVTIKDNINSGDIKSDGKEEVQESEEVKYSLACSGGIVGNIYNAGYVYNNENTASKIEATVFAAGIVGSLQPNKDNSFADKKDIRVYDNISKTVDENIDGKNKHLYVYNNDTKGEYTKVENNMSEAVATVNGKNYGTLELAIKAAMSGEDKTVKLLSDIKVATWNQIWNIKGITLDGNGKTITVDKIESLENHDAVLHSAGGNTFKNLTIDLRSVKPGKAQGIRAISASDNDTIDNVTIIGGPNASYGITAGSSCKNLTVKNSNISNCGHGVYLEGANDATVVINNNTFDGCEYAAILYSKNSTFKENTVKGGKVNIMHKESVVRENTFEAKDKTKSRIKFYEDGIKFEYNKIMNNSNGEAGATVVFATASDTKVDPINPRSIVLDNNYWGSDEPKLEEIIKLSKDNGVGEGDTLEALIKDVIEKVERNRFDTPKELEDALNPNTGGGIVIPSTPSKPSKPTYKHEEIVGSDRYDTAAKIADKLGSYDNVVLVNAESSMSDGLSASGLAGKENGAILLTKKDSIPKATMDRIKKVKKVYIIGREAAISQKVYDEITAAGIKVERLGGKDRVETSEIVAKKLGNYSDAFVVNGFKGEADAMSASAIAAKKGAPILLTNGKTSTHSKKSGVEYYVIGGNSVVDKSIADKYNAEVLAGKDRYATNKEVINEFYSGSDKVYIANGDKLVDALTASPLAKKDGIVLVNEKSDKNILKGKNTVQVGGMDFEIEFEK